MIDSILVTGGLGYVGGRIASHLLNGGKYAVRVGTSRENPSPPPWLGSGRLVHVNLEDENNLLAACRDVRCVVHLAALNEIDSLADPVKAFMVNSLGSLRLLRAAESAGVERFIYFSTAHVYGAPLVNVISEETLPMPVHPYAITHHAAEDFVLAAHKKGTLTGIVLRLSNGFGAPADADVNRWTLIVNDLCRQAVTLGRLELRSSGLQHRDFIPLRDVCRAVEHFFNLPAAECRDGLFNLGGNCSIPIFDLAQRIADRCNAVLGFNPPIVRPDPKEGESSELLDYRIDKLKATGFFLSGKIDEEIDATLKLCKKSFGDSR